MEYNVISADNHIVEPRDLFATRLPKAFRDRAPQVMRGPDGGDGWSWDGKPPSHTFGLEATAGRRTQVGGYKWEDILPGNYDPTAHLADMALCGVDAAMLHPTVTLAAWSMGDSDFALALLQTFNDWLFDEFVAKDPKRLIGLPMMPVNHGIEATLAEAKRCLEKGAKALHIPVYPDIPYTEHVYDPLWALASDADVPICLHRTSGGKPPGEKPFSPAMERSELVASSVFRYFAGIEPLTLMIYTGVFKRHPKLRVVDAELNFGWVPFWKQTMDQCFLRQKAWANFGVDGMPSDYLGRNVFVTVLDDKVGFDLVKTDPQLADMALFSIDYPHSVCLWPNTSEYIESSAENCDPVSKKKILAGNAVRVFQLN